MRIALTVLEKQDSRVFTPEAIPGTQDSTITVGSCPPPFSPAIHSEMIEIPGIRVLFNNLVIQAPQVLEYAIETPCFGVACFSLKGHLLFLLPRGKRVNMPAMTFNILSLSTGKGKMILRAGVYQFCLIQFTSPYLQSFAEQYPLLETFLSKCGSMHAGVLTKHNGRLVPSMLRAVMAVRGCKFTGITREQYLQAKINELMIMSLYDLFANTKIPLSVQDVQILQSTRKLLLNNLHNHYSIPVLSKKVGMNDFKLKKGFRQLFGDSIYNFLLHARMEKAKYMLVSTDEPIKSIAKATGYGNLSNFIAVFKKKLGVSPALYKSKRIIVLEVQKTLPITILIFNNKKKKE
ncbi:AraC-like DNA-binding protein [Chitinophaga skermanii]|uniref:AraC-like DNA-binding protein n=1 Tax=Chitinophaga skermanii TaxID=331697 RepID=A0A327QQ34_9BACT|nr:AraC family transcriptional regulator [Chitinophaga skermanii]RAJ06689.1 AraC-like DNA-binding protein [Chitinophaga skermanii]